MMRPGLDLIAQRAGVSIATVSRVMNNQPSVSDEKREKVLTAIRELSPPLRQGMIFALIFPDPENPFFTDLALRFDLECERMGTTLLVATSYGRADRELELIDRFANVIGVDGILFISAGTGQSPPLLKALSGADTSLVSVDRGAGDFDRTTSDSTKGTEEAVDHLLGFRHERIGYIRGQVGTETAIEREDSFRAAMAKNRLEVNPAWVFEGDYRIPTGRECADQLIAMDPAERPTAILAANDLMAIGLIQKLLEAGWNLPTDMSVIGFDGIAAGDWIHPRLTTIAQPVKQLVQQALGLLRKRISEASAGLTDQGHEVIVLEPRLLRPGKSVSEPRSETKLTLLKEG
jgi:DNA-binding LacI/PurR family transcriptional regulator